MNKAITINLGGIFFHIDEDAYGKLSLYLETLKHSLANYSRQQEIIDGVEIHIANLLRKNNLWERNVIRLAEINDAIATIKKPEDYLFEKSNEEQQQPSSSDKNTKSQKKLYRDDENGIIGGVAAGLGHYFGIDAVWFRIFFLLLLFSLGTGSLIYLIFWIATPKAKTLSEKAEMRKEPFTISDVETKVKEEFTTVSDKIKNADYDVIGENIKYKAKKLNRHLGGVLNDVLKVFAKILGFILILISLTVLFFVLIGFFLGTGFFDFPWYNFVMTSNLTHNYPIWLFAIMLFSFIGAPFLLLALLGFKLLFPHLKSIRNIAKYALFTLFSLWVITLVFLTFIMTTFF